MKRTLVLFILLSSVLLAACDTIDVRKVSDADMVRIANTAIVCNSPYIRFETGCCLDQNNNSICDRDDVNSSLLTEVPNLSENISYGKIISNSADWRDVYSSMLYASMSDVQPGLFIVTPASVPVILEQISTDEKVFVITSRDFSYVSDLKIKMDAQGYELVNEITSNTVNLDLAKRINKERHVRKFIIVDDKYGYDALSVASYAIVDDYFVLFANDRNIDTVAKFLSDVKPQNVIIFGQFNEPVKTQLALFNPEIINKGDRFSNNIEVVKKYREINNSKQVLLTGGEFIEPSLVSGENAVILIEKDGVSSSTINYINESGFQVAVLIGNNLIDSATIIRQQLNISVFVKFAQKSRNSNGTVEDLDKFPLPVYLS